MSKDYKGILITKDLLLELGCDYRGGNHYTLDRGGYYFSWSWRQSECWDFCCMTSDNRGKGPLPKTHQVTHFDECLVIVAVEAFESALDFAWKAVRERIDSATGKPKPDPDSA